MAEVSLKRYRFVDKERDNESGFYYIGARYYCPWLARWLAPDPISSEMYNHDQGNPGRNIERQFVELTASSYEYCYANPVRFTDPTGEQPPIGYTNVHTQSVTGVNPMPAQTAGGIKNDQSNNVTLDKNIHFFLGSANAVLTNLIGGVGRVSPENIKGPYGIDYARGQLAGDITSMAIGQSMTTGGVVGGIITSETGVGALAGASVAAWGEGVSASGAIHAAITTSYILNYSGNDVSSSDGYNSGNTGNSNSSENPKYVPSPRHEKGGPATLMDLSDKEAQELLNNSKQLDKQRYGFTNGKIYEFKNDNSGGWHGYPLEKAAKFTIKSGASKILKEWKNEGIITQPQLNRLLNGRY